MEELGFWAKNGGKNLKVGEVTADIGLKMSLGGLGKCLKVVKLTKIGAKLTKSGSVAR